MTVMHTVCHDVVGVLCDVVDVSCDVFDVLCDVVDVFVSSTRSSVDWI